MTYADATHYLFGLRRFGWRPGLATMERLLGLLGRPEVGLPALHVAGTNGKGSTAAILAAILRAGGRRTGLYTSPHLESFTERIQVDGIPIAEAEVAELTARLQAIGAEHFPPGREPAHPTFFELTTAMAFLHFRRRAVEVAVVEVGLGGRLDATNVIRPLTAVITNIGLEHQEYLGETIREIAAEKAGIIKPGVPVVTGAAGEALAVIRQVALDRGASVIVVGDLYTPTLRASGLHGLTFDLQGPRRRYEALALPLAGRHQVDNAVVAIAAAETLETRGLLGVGGPAIPEGLRRACWPGRLQIVAQRPRLLLDGAHNPDGIQRLAGFLEEHRRALGRVALIFGVLADKPHTPMLARLLPLVDEVLLTRPPSDRAADPLAVRDGVGLADRGRLAPELGDALRLARTLVGPDDTILVCGSLYTVGAALRALRPGDAAAQDPGD